MKTKWVLTQLIPRAYTTDTSIIAIADTKEELENYFDTILNQAKEKHDELEYLDFFKGTFQIVETKYIS